MSEAARAFIAALLAEPIPRREFGAGARGPHRHPAGTPAIGAKAVPGVTPSPRKLSRKAAEAKGRRLQLLMRDYFVAQGCRVEVARKAVVWYFNERLGKRTFAQVRHDYYGLWDLIVQWPSGARTFCQVTTLHHVHDKRVKILQDGFPTTREDIIAGHEKGRTFRVLRGPAFALTSERVEVAK